MVHKLNAFEIQKRVFVHVDRKDFEKYVKVQASGVTNMFDLRTVESLTGLDRDKIKAIAMHYDELDKLYPDVRENAKW